MRRRLAPLLAVLAFALGSTPEARAASRGGAREGSDTAKPPDLKAMVERNKRCLREASAHVSNVTFGRKDLERYLAEWASFDALDFGDKDDAGPQCIDLAAAVKNPKYVAWCRERGLEPKAWLLSSARITLTRARQKAPAEAAQMKEQMETQKREMAKHCKSMGPTACRDMEQAFAQGDDMMRETAAMMALFPEPTRAEAALLTEYDERLTQAMDARHGGRGRSRSPAGEQDALPDDDAPGDAEPDEPPPRRPR